MTHNKDVRMVEICPQCHKEVDGSTSRLVSDGCGHAKCRICLLQEINGCLKCAANKLDYKPLDKEPKSLQYKEQPQRRSVIVSTNEVAQDSGTHQVIQQSLQNDILFPTDIVKRSTGNFFHLKRLISARYYKEGGGKEDKCCETEKICGPIEKKGSEDMPGHIVYFCAVHQKELSNPDALEKHKKCIGVADNEFICYVCSKNFPSSYKLNRHMRSHQPPPKFQCATCSKKFKDNYALNTHQRIHTGLKAFTCQICNVQLKQLWSLKRHLAAHKGDKKYSCDHCKSKFLTKAELNRHMTSHSKSKAYSCKTCNVKFSCQRSLMRHKESHNPTTVRLRCEHCGASFKRKDNLLRHEKNIHGTEHLSAPHSPADATTNDS